MGMWRKTWSAAQLFIGISVWVWLLLQYGKGEIQNVSYFVLYICLGLALILHGAITWLYDFGKSAQTASKSLVGQALFSFEESPMRPLSFGVLPWFVFFIVTLLIAVAMFGRGAVFFDPVVTGSPYLQGVGLSQSDMTQYSFIQNIALGAVIPALFEEGVTFFGIQAFTALSIIGLAGVFKNPRLIGSKGLYWLVTLLLSLPLFSYLFAVAHGRYAQNEGALLYAFTFEYVVQLCNQLTGSFLSWIPHLVHNAIVVADLQFSSGFLAAVLTPALSAIFIPYWPRKREASHE